MGWSRAFRRNKPAEAGTPTGAGERDGTRGARPDPRAAGVRVTWSFRALWVSTMIVVTSVNEWAAPPFHPTTTLPAPTLVICTMLVLGRLTVTVRIEPV